MIDVRPYGRRRRQGADGVRSPKRTVPKGGQLSGKAEEKCVLRGQLKIEPGICQEVVIRLRNVGRREHADIQGHQQLFQSYDICGHGRVVVLHESLNRAEEPSPVFHNRASNRTSELFAAIGWLAAPAMLWIGEVVDLGEFIAAAVAKRRTVKLVAARFRDQAYAGFGRGRET